MAFFIQKNLKQVWRRYNLRDIENFRLNVMQRDLFSVLKQINISILMQRHLSSIFHFIVNNPYVFFSARGFL